MAFAALRQDITEQDAQAQPPQEGGPRFSFQDKEIDEHPELVNLAKFMDPKDLAEIGQMCYEEFKEDDDSRQDWLKMQEDWVKLYHGKLKPLDPPWEHASDDHLPILSEGCTQFHARAYKAFFASLNFVSSMPIGNIRSEDQNRAERVGKYMSWQLGVKDKTYKRRKDRLLKALPLHGSYFTKTYRDNLNQRIGVENVSPIDLVANYTCIGTDIEDLERKTQCIYLPQRMGRYYGSEATKNYFLHPPGEMPLASDKSTGIREAINKITGMEPPATYASKRPAKILEQHRYLDLDGDGIEEPYIVWVDAATQQVLRIAIRWSFDAWSRTNYKDPLEYFTHYVYIENPDGFYGFGQGHLVGDLNIAVDKLLRQFINAATLQNSQPGFATQQAGIKSGKIEVQPGRVKKLNFSGDIRQAVMMLQNPGPSEPMWRAMSLLAARADRLNMVTDMLTGQSEKVFQTGATNSLIEQGLMVFSAVQIRVHAALEQELAKIFRLNGIYLDDEQYFLFNDGQTEEEYTVFRTDFNDDLQVRPAFDPHQLTERERKQQVMMEYQAAMQNPVIQQSPKHLTAATERFFKGMGSTNINEIVPNFEQDVAPQMQQRSQAQQQMMEEQKKLATMAATTNVVKTQAQMLKDRKTAELQDRKLDIEEAALAVDAQDKISQNALQTVQLVSEIDAIRDQQEQQEQAPLGQ